MRRREAGLSDQPPRPRYALRSLPQARQGRLAAFDGQARHGAVHGQGCDYAFMSIADRHGYRHDPFEILLIVHPVVLGTHLRELGFEV